MRRIFTSPETIQGDIIHITDNDDIYYLTTVLRMNKGDGLYVSDGAGRAWETNISEIGKGGIRLDVVMECPADEGAGTDITLYQGLPKGAKMDDTIRKSVEIGVSRIIPVVTARSVPGADTVPASKLTRWGRIAGEAARQSRRARIPEVRPVQTLKEAAAGLAGEGYDLILVLYELEEGRTLKHALQGGRDRMRKSGVDRPPRAAVFIGPEGGFEREEVDCLLNEGAEAVTIGENILRTETAGPAAIAMILYEYEQ